MVLERHLDSLASAVSAELATIGSGETYALPTASTSTKGGIIVGDGLSMRGDTLNVTVSSGETYSVFTGATSSTGGHSGLVPEPSIGDQDKFLRGDGSWGTPANTGAGIALNSVASGVEGALWRDSINDSPVLKLRHGDYEYNFNYDGLTFLGGSSSAIATVTPDTYVLGTATVSSEGGLWYDTANDTPKLNLHAGNFVYSFGYDTITYKGDNSNLVSYLPFDSSTTNDACGNSWTVTGTASISSAQSKFGGNSLYLDGSSYLAMDNGITLGGQDFTVDCWVYIISSSYGRVFEISVNETNGTGTTSCIVEYPDGTHFNTSLSGSGGSVSGFSSRNAWHHCALVYSHAAQTTYGFIDGQLLSTKSGEFSRALFQQIFISQSNYFNSGGHINGYFSHFRIFDGVALWTSDFTPPTAADYS